MRSASDDDSDEVSFLFRLSAMFSTPADGRRGHLKDIGYPAPRTVSKLEDQVFLF